MDLRTSYPKARPMRVLSILLFLLMLILNLGAQERVGALLLDAKSGEPVIFANVGIPGKGLGTVSDESGKFSMIIPDSLKELSVRISCIGYLPKTFPVAQWSLEKIKLEPDVKLLQEVTVAAPKLKVKIVGNDTKSSHITAGFKENHLGTELGVRLNIKKPNTEIRKFFLNIVYNSLDTTPVFRLNVYTIDKDGKPSENVLKENILFSPKEKTGLMEIDLSSYHILVNDDVFISMEWVKDLGNITGLGFSTKLGGSDTYYRLTSQDDWKKIGVVGIGLHAEIAY